MFFCFPLFFHPKLVHPVNVVHVIMGQYCRMGCRVINCRLVFSAICYSFNRILLKFCLSFYLFFSFTGCGYQKLERHLIVKNWVLTVWRITWPNLNRASWIHSLTHLKLASMKWKEEGSLIFLIFSIKLDFDNVNSKE